MSLWKREFWSQRVIYKKNWYLKVFKLLNSFFPGWKAKPPHIYFRSRFSSKKWKCPSPKAVICFHYKQSWQCCLSSFLPPRFKTGPASHTILRLRERTSTSASRFVPEKRLPPCIYDPETGTCSTGQSLSYSRDHVRKPPLPSRIGLWKRWNPEEGFRSLFFLTREIPLSAMETVPESGTGPVSSASLSVWALASGSRGLASWSWISTSFCS